MSVLMSPWEYDYGTQPRGPSTPPLIMAWTCARQAVQGILTHTNGCSYGLALIATPDMRVPPVLTSAFPWHQLCHITALLQHAHVPRNTACLQPRPGILDNAGPSKLFASVPTFPGAQHACSPTQAPMILQALASFRSHLLEQPVHCRADVAAGGLQRADVGLGVVEPHALRMHNNSGRQTLVPHAPSCHLHSMRAQRSPQNPCKGKKLRSVHAPCPPAPQQRPCPASRQRRARAGCGQGCNNSVSAQQERPRRAGP